MAHRERVFINGKQAPSVTQVLNMVAKPYLYRWYAKHGWDGANAIKNAASAIGNRVHNGIEEYLKGNEWAYTVSSDREKQMVNTFVSWASESKFKAIETECHVSSEQYIYHGTIDGIGGFWGEEEFPPGYGLDTVVASGKDLFVLDWKTSSKIDDTYGIQLAAYAQAYNETHGTSIDCGGVVRLAKDADDPKQIEVKQFNGLSAYFKVFLSLKDVWNFSNKKGIWQKGD